MKKQFVITTVVVLLAYVLSACGGALPATELPASDQAAVKVQAVEVAFTGVVEAMSGSDWTVNGQVLAVDPAVVRDGPFQVGDTIKVEGTVNTDGSLSISRVEAPSAADLANLPQLGNDNANSNDNNSNDANANTNVNANLNSNESISNDASTNGNDDNFNDDNGNINSNDDSTNDDDGNVNTNNNSANTNLNSNDDQGNSNDNTNDDDSGGRNDNDNGGNDNSDDNGSNSNDD